MSYPMMSLMMVQEIRQMFPSFRILLVPLLFSWAPQICVCVATKIAHCFFFPKTYSFYIRQVKKGSLGNSSCATCQNQVNREKSHCTIQPMTRGEFCLESGTTVNVQLSFSYWAGSPDFIAVALSSTCGIFKITLDTFLIYPMNHTNTNQTCLILKFN